MEDSAVRGVRGVRGQSSVEMATSTMSEPNGGGKRTWERPLRELTGVPDDREEAEEKESDPWEEGAGTPLDTGGGAGKQREGKR